MITPRLFPSSHEYDSIIIRTADDFKLSDYHTAKIREVFVSSLFSAVFHSKGSCKFQLVIDNHPDTIEAKKAHPLELIKWNGSAVVVTYYTAIKNYNVLYIAEKLKNEFSLTINSLSIKDRACPFPTELFGDNITHDEIPNRGPGIFTIEFEKTKLQSKL